MQYDIRFTISKKLPEWECEIDDMKDAEDYALWMESDRSVHRWSTM